MVGLCFYSFIYCPQTCAFSEYLIFLVLVTDCKASCILDKCSTINLTSAVVLLFLGNILLGRLPILIMNFWFSFLGQQCSNRNLLRGVIHNTWLEYILIIGFKTPSTPGLERQLRALAVASWCSLFLKHSVSGLNN